MTNSVAVLPAVILNLCAPPAKLNVGVYSRDCSTKTSFPTLEQEGKAYDQETKVSCNKLDTTYTSLGILCL